MLCYVSLASKQQFGLPTNCHIAMDSEGMTRTQLRVESMHTSSLTTFVESW